MKSVVITKVLLLSVVGLFAAGIAQAGNNYSTTFVTISNLVFYSASDDIYPLYDGTVVVNFGQPVVWRLGNNCATGAVAIRSGDKTLMTAVQTALATDDLSRFLSTMLRRSTAWFAISGLSRCDGGKKRRFYGGCRAP